MSANISVNPPGSIGCINFTSLVLDDNIALEGNESFIIKLESSSAVVTIIDDDGEYQLPF